MPLMALLYQAEDKPSPIGPPRDQVARQQLHGFVQQVCQSQAAIVTAS
jgi:hypothetical protein